MKWAPTGCPLDKTDRVLAEAFRANGYATAGFVANVRYASSESGLSRGFIHYEDYTLSFAQLLRSSAVLRHQFDWMGRLRDFTRNYQRLGRKTATDVNREVLRWLPEQPNGRPWFVFLNYLEVHHPYWPPEPFDSLFGPKAPRHNPRLDLGQRWTPEQVASEQRYYDRCLAYLDHELSALFDELARRRQLDNTVVIISSDHGERFGEHGFMMHGLTLYPSVLHVPSLSRTRHGYRRRASRHQCRRATWPRLRSIWRASPIATALLARRSLRSGPAANLQRPTV